MSDHTCPFCEPGDRPIILQNDLAMAFYDKYPVAPGHLLIVPLRHFPSWFDATCEEKTAMDQLLTQGRQLLAREFHAASFNLGINVGAAAGQTVMHLHVHLIPRRTGDTPDPRGGVRGVIPGKQRY